MRRERPIPEEAKASSLGQEHDLISPAGYNLNPQHSLINVAANVFRPLHAIALPETSEETSHRLNGDLVARRLAISHARAGVGPGALLVREAAKHVRAKSGNSPNNGIENLKLLV